MSDVLIDLESARDGLPIHVVRGGDYDGWIERQPPFAKAWLQSVGFQAKPGRSSLVPGADWTLEDCQPAPLPQVMPDLAGLELAPAGSGGALEPERVVRPPPEVPGLSLDESDTDGDRAPANRPD